ncbi:bifunctional aconitate hydratase 2/2-methylisocitrate dehydratase [bacterium]|nr:bifunctional aconitate hydratase 2/2-methylisocitrate dehydratase [bacterium]
MNDVYRKHAAERAAMGIPPLPLNAAHSREVCELLMDPESAHRADLPLLVDRISPGVDPAAQVKASFLADIARGRVACPLIDRRRAVELLGTMLGGYNLNPLIEFLEVPELADEAAKALSRTLLVFDAWRRVLALAESGNRAARRVIDSWAAAEWFTSRPPLPERINAVVFKVDGEINTDDLSPAVHAVSRADIPRHALAMGEKRFPGGIDKIAELKQVASSRSDLLTVVAFVGDVVGTGSSRKSAVNSLLWHIGEDIPFIPNKRRGGVVLGGVIAPIFFNTLEDAGALPIECDVSKLVTGQRISIFPFAGRIEDESGNVLSTFRLKPNTLPDEYRAGGRVSLIIGKTLTNNVREAVGRVVDPTPGAKSRLTEPTYHFIAPNYTREEGVGFTLAQKMIGRACGTDGIHPGTSCTPVVTSVGSQDTTGPMTRDEMIELACLGFSADLVMQSFCHTAAYPTDSDRLTHATLPGFITDRGGVSLRPGDGIIHSWLNRMLLPDTVGTGGDSHTRFPIGISFPAGSGLVAFAAALGVMPLQMPESVLVRFSGKLRKGITLRDAVNAIPYFAIKQGLLTVPAKNKKNVFSGRILEIEGLPDLKVEQAFELSDASAERSAAACTIELNAEPVAEYLRSNIALMKSMIEDGYQSAKALERRIGKMDAWLEDPKLLERDANARYAAVIEIDLSDITEPLLACPNNPDDIRPLSEVAGDAVQEVFIGSCMTNIGHYRAAARVLDGAAIAASRLWVCPPTRMDEFVLREEGYYKIFENLKGCRTELPGCSLCMGNQARLEPGTTCVSTSTRNFQGRMGDNTRVYLAGAELAAVTAMQGHIPTPDEYRAATEKLDVLAPEIYRFMNFDQMKKFRIAPRKR